VNSHLDKVGQKEENTRLTVPGKKQIHAAVLNRSRTYKGCSCGNMVLIERLEKCGKRLLHLRSSVKE